jgi:hypothetical protein
VKGNLWFGPGLSACGTVYTWAAHALVDIDIAVAGKYVIIVTLHHSALRSECSDIVIFAHTVGKSSGACALVGMQGYCNLYCRLGACGPVYTWAACTLIDVDITGAAKFCAVGTLHHCALRLVLHDIVIVTDTISETSNTRALVCVEGHLWLYCRLRARGAVGAWAAGALVDIDIAVATKDYFASVSYLWNKFIRTHAIGETGGTLAAVFVQRYFNICSRVRACSAICTRAAVTL